MASREELLRIAQDWASELAQRPGVRGIFLYGSLVGDPEDLTEFSDVDVALVLEDSHLPAHFAEHRIREGIKTDTTLLATSTLQRWTEKPPSRLFEDGWLGSLFLRGLTVGGHAGILYDPQGGVADAVEALPPYRALALPDARQWVSDFRQKEATLQPEWLEWTVRFVADTKRLPLAAERLGIPEFAQVLAEWKQAVLPDAVVLTAACEAREALATLAQKHVYAPVRATVPGELELAGEWPLFWPGNRVNSLERVCGELETTVRWSQSLRARSKLAAALEMLWPCTGEETRKRTMALQEALAAYGHDIAALTEQFYASASLREAEACVVTADASVARKVTSPELVERALVLLERVVSG